MVIPQTKEDSQLNSINQYPQNNDDLKTKQQMMTSIIVIYQIRKKHTMEQNIVVTIIYELMQMHRGIPAPLAAAPLIRVRPTIKGL